MQSVFYVIHLPSFLYSMQFFKQWNKTSCLCSYTKFYAHVYQITQVSLYSTGFSFDLSIKIDGDYQYILINVKTF